MIKMIKRCFNRFVKEFPWEPGHSDIVEMIESFGVICVEKGDVVVVKTPMHISFAQMMNIQEHVTNIMPHGNKVLVLSHGMDIGTMRSTDQATNDEGTPDIDTLMFTLPVLFKKTQGDGAIASLG